MKGAGEVGGGMTETEADAKLHRLHRLLGGEPVA